MDGDTYWLVDGFHRLKAHQQLNLKTIEADVRTGTLEDAKWASYGANTDHGLRRTNADKKRAVENALRHPKSASLSDRQIAKHCGVSNDMVSRYRNSICHNMTDKDRAVTRNGKTYTMDTSNIGKPKIKDLPDAPVSFENVSPTPQPHSIRPDSPQPLLFG